MNFIATIEDNVNLNTIVEYLEKIGYKISKVRRISRNISGHTSQHSLSDLRSVKGIKFAEEERNIYNA